MRIGIISIYAKGGILVATSCPKDSYAPVFGIGRRVMDLKSLTGIDFSINGSLKKSHQHNYNSYCGRDRYNSFYFLPIEYIKMKRSPSKLYYAIGGGFGGIHLYPTKKDKHHERMYFHGLMGSGKVGYEFTRKNQLISFGQLSLTQPLVPITSKNAKSFAPIIQLDIGFGF